MEACLEVDSVLHAFGDRTILSDVYLCCRPGDIIGLFGRNGTGKSTLLKIIFGTLKGDRSFVRINGQILNTPSFLSGKIAYLPQHPFLPGRQHIRQMLDLYLGKEQVKTFLADPFLFKSRNLRVGEMSGGAQRYLEIKLALSSPVPYVLLDEPFNGLSPVAAEAVRNLITHNALTKGIILTDHNFREVHRVVNRILLLDECYLKPINDVRELIRYGYYEEKAQ